MDYELHQGDCLDVLPTLRAGSVDAVITDPPYGTTACAWDSVIPLAPMWAELKRVLKPRGAVVLFAAQPFTSALVMSNAEWFKWADVWRKSHATGHLNSGVMPLRQHEDILVFGRNRVTYNPQIEKKPAYNVRPSRHSKAKSECYGNYRPDAETTIPLDMSYPRSVVDFDSPNHGEKGLHSTQKPIELMRYLVRTYTNAGDTVLDFTMGSGTTGVACRMEGRRFIGIELDPAYFAIAQRRIANAQPPLFVPDAPAEPQATQAVLLGD